MSICQKYNCEKCPSFNECGGCEKCHGQPFGSKEPCICVRIINEKSFQEFQNTIKHITNEINCLNIPGLHVDDMNVLPGSYVNLEYPLSNGETVKFLKDDKTYFANQIEIDKERCYGVVSDGTFILVASYGVDGKDPKLLIYKSI